jgi:hypothetical protein
VISLFAPQLLCHGGDRNRKANSTRWPLNPDGLGASARLRSPPLTVARHDTVSRARQGDDCPGRKNSIDHAARRLLGNFPQAMSHMSLINTARNLARQSGPAEYRADKHAG